MFAVRDDLSGQCIEEQGRLHHAAAHGICLALAKPGAVGHGTKQMIYVTDSPADCCCHLLERRVRMPGVACDSVVPALPDKLLRAGQFWRDRGRGDAVGEIEVFPVLARLRCTHRFARMATTRFDCEVRPVKMSTQYPRAAGSAGPERAADFEEREVLVVPGDRGRGQK